MSLHGIVKGRPFEAFVEKMMQGEATGVMMYYALARLAKEQGLDEVSKEFMAIGNEEAFHSGFYAVLKGAYPQDFWNLVRSLQKVEAAGEEKIGLPVYRKPLMKWLFLPVRKGGMGSA